MPETTPTQTQFLDMEAALLTSVFGLRLYRSEEIISPDFRGQMPYAYKIPNEDSWKIVYPQGTATVMPMRSLDGAYWTAAQTLRWLHEARIKSPDGAGGGYYDVVCTPKFDPGGKITMRFVVTFEREQGHVISRGAHEYFEVAMGMACLRACGKEVDESTWRVM